jgi:hypothetical protein
MIFAAIVFLCILLYILLIIQYHLCARITKSVPEVLKLQRECERDLLEISRKITELEQRSKESK